MRPIVCLNLCFLLFLTAECGLVLDMVDKMKSGVNSVVDWKMNAIKNIGDKVNSAIDGVGCIVGKHKHKIVITENDVHRQEEFEGAYYNEGGRGPKEEFEGQYHNEGGKGPKEEFEGEHHNEGGRDPQQEFEGQYHNEGGRGPNKEENKYPHQPDNKVGYSDDNVEIDIRIRA